MLVRPDQAIPYAAACGKEGGIPGSKTGTPKAHTLGRQIIERMERGISCGLPSKRLVARAEKGG
jgi:hypothetical protein